MKPAVFHDQAIVELEKAVAWYEGRLPGLGGKFRSAVEDAVSRIIDNPRIGLDYESTRFRYVLVRRFPYIVFYAEDSRRLTVMAVAHGRRRPGYWQERETG